MSLKYFCDFCKSEIKLNSKVSLQVCDEESGKKAIFHYHSSCYKKYIKTIVEGSLLSKSENSSVPMKKEVSEKSQDTTIKKECSNSSENSFVLKEKILTVDIDRDKFKEWELTNAKGITKYFTNANTAIIHRFFFLDTSIRAISNFFRFPYQTIALYSRDYRNTVLSKYKPTIAEETLEKIWIKHRKDIPKILALFGSANKTWTVQAISYECDIPIETVQAIWDELPYFVEKSKTEK